MRRTRRYQMAKTIHARALVMRLTGPPSSREASSTPKACSSRAGACQRSRMTSVHDGLLLAMNKAMAHCVPKLSVKANIIRYCSASGRNFGGACRKASP
jgi:hypothetical protein